MDEKPKSRWLQFSLQHLLWSMLCFSVAAAIATRMPKASDYDFESMGQAFAYNLDTGFAVFFLSPFVGTGIGCCLGKHWWLVGAAIGVLWLPSLMFASLIYNQQ